MQPAARDDDIGQIAVGPPPLQVVGPIKIPFDHGFRAQRDDGKQRQRDYCQPMNSETSHRGSLVTTGWAGGNGFCIKAGSGANTHPHLASRNAAGWVGQQEPPNRANFGGAGHPRDAANSAAATAVTASTAPLPQHSLRDCDSRRQGGIRRAVAVSQGDLIPKGGSRSVDFEATRPASMTKNVPLTGLTFRVLMRAGLSAVTV
ncbi:MAG: hypothetical protein BWX84_01921 [Verrucomicrobia bacterium ADurb.Bin118]|nr:MAG: hypothetical protein BWX84_01921 [Verrucomicrobia bacterium ADurb.Bin118]